MVSHRRIRGDPGQGSQGRLLAAGTFDYMLGRYRRGNGQLYVSGGTGHWLPFRLGVPAEVTVFTLRAEA